ncbi:MAG: ABC transporter substrate-binding protein [Rhizobiales bacterium]|nr:ABC transporter substrate-binding protein [Hyphomicrobiales bacterium]
MKSMTFKAALVAATLFSTVPGQAADQLSVLLPPWGTLPKELTDEFAAKQGVELDTQTLGWDEIRTKIVTSMVANTAPASATEVDWSWVGQFGAAGWYQPLNDGIAEDVLADVPTASIFSYDGNVLGVTYNNDFRVMIYNKNHLTDAGVEAVPTTPDELLAAARAVKEKGIADHPIGLPLSASEGTSTAWYLLTKAFGGDLFDENFEPLFTDPESAGYKAMEFEISALEEGLIDPAATGLKDVEIQELFKSGKITFDVAGWAGNLSVYTDAEKSQVADGAAAALMISTTGKARTIGLPEAVGIPTGAENKDGAVAFINWLLEPEIQIAAYETLGNLPARLSVLEKLNADGKLVEGDIILKQAALVEPMFAQGAPAWYPDFSTSVSSNLNLAAKGQITVEEAVNNIAADVEAAK